MSDMEIFRQLLRLLAFGPDDFHQSCFTRPSPLNFIPYLTTLRPEKRNERFVSKRFATTPRSEDPQEIRSQLDHADFGFHSRANIPSDRTHVGGLQCCRLGRGHVQRNERTEQCRCSFLRVLLSKILGASPIGDEIPETPRSIAA